MSTNDSRDILNTLSSLTHRRGRALTEDEIRDVLAFREPGGLARAVAALQAWTALCAPKVNAK